MTTIVADKQQLIAMTNNKLTGFALNDSFSLLLGLKQPSLSSSCLQERVNEGCDQSFGCVAKNFARARLAQLLPSSYPGYAPDYQLVVGPKCTIGIRLIPRLSDLFKKIEEPGDKAIKDDQLLNFNIPLVFFYSEKTDAHLILYGG